MPYSSPKGKSQTAEWVYKNSARIKNVLDVGAGSGTYYHLMHSYIPKATWVAIEVWEPYIKEFHLENIYSTVINKDVRKINWKNMSKYSLAFTGDVLEHITKEEAVEVVDGLLGIVDTLIISIPVVYFPQGEYAGNPHEIHIKDDWSDEEMKETWGQYIKQSYVEDEIGVYWLSKN